MPISSELAFLLRNIMLKVEFDLSKIETWVQGQKAKVLKEFCRKISIPEIEFHTLRACFASQLISDGKI